MLLQHPKKAAQGPVTGLGLFEIDEQMGEMVGRVAAQRAVGGAVVPLFANHGFLPFLKNLLCSMSRVGVRNWFVIAMDNATCPELEKPFLLGQQMACVNPYHAGCLPLPRSHAHPLPSQTVGPVSSSRWSHAGAVSGREALRQPHTGPQCST